MRLYQSEFLPEALALAQRARAAAAILARAAGLILRRVVPCPAGFVLEAVPFWARNLAQRARAAAAILARPAADIWRRPSFAEAMEGRPPFAEASSFAEAMEGRELELEPERIAESSELSWSSWSLMLAARRSWSAVKEEKDSVGIGSDGSGLLEIMKDEF